MGKYGRYGITFAELDTAGLEHLLVGKDAISRRRMRYDADDGEVNTIIFVPDFTPRVQHGVVVLDAVAPGWANEINLGVLDLQNANQCVLGQTWPHYSYLLGLAENARAGLDDNHPVDVLLCDLSPYDQMLLRMTATMGNERDHFAASIGCTLSVADFMLANLQAKQSVVERVGSVIAASPPGQQEMSSLAEQTVLQMFEQLTYTWLREISAIQAVPVAYPEEHVVDLRAPIRTDDRELLKT